LSAPGPTGSGVFLATAFDNAHEITNSVDVVDHDLIDLDADDLIFNRNHQFETIEPVGPKVIAEARFVCQTIGINSKMSGNDLAYLDCKAVIHGGSSQRTVKMGPRIAVHIP